MCWLRRGALLSFVVVLIVPVVAEAQGDDPFGAPAAGPTVPPPMAPPAADPSAKPDIAKADDAPLEVPIPRPPVDPELVRLHLQDGTALSGKFAVKHLSVETEFGVLEIPITKLRSFTPGLANRAQFYSQICQWIEDLGGDDFQQREAAQQQLVRIGLPIRKELQLHLKGADPEQAQRIKTILDHLDELDGDEEDEAENKEWIRDDIVETTRFTILGKVSPQSFELTSKYGTITVNLDDIEVVSGALDSAPPVHKRMNLTGQFIAQLKFKSSGIRVEPGDQITVSATGQISRSGSSSYVSGPDGSTKLGQFVPSISGGTLVAKVGGEGRVVRVGSKGKFTSKRSGVLQFGIGMRPDYVGRYQFLGQYDLKVRVERQR